jgi:hypothetical protein
LLRSRSACTDLPEQLCELGSMLHRMSPLSHDPSIGYPERTFFADRLTLSASATKITPTSHIPLFPRNKNKIIYYIYYLLLIKIKRSLGFMRVFSLQDSVLATPKKPERQT